MKRLLKSRALFGLVGFVLGAAVMWLAQRVQVHATFSKVAQGGPAAAGPQAPEDDDPFAGMMDDDPFEQMRKMQEQLRRSMLHGMNGMHANTGEIRQREDKDFVYYDISIKGLDPRKLNVKVSDGQVIVDGQTQSGDQGAAFFTSSFHRSIPVPEGVDGNRVQMEQDKDRLTLKFPKA